MKTENFHASVQIQLKEHAPFPIPARSTKGRPSLFIFQLTEGAGAFPGFYFISVAWKYPKPTDRETQLSALRSPVNRIITRNCRWSAFLGSFNRARALFKRGPCFCKPSLAAPLEFDLSGLLEQQITQHRNCGVPSVREQSLFYEAT